MAWIRLDDQIAHHPKVLKVGLSAWLYVGCIAFAQRFLTDGFIPDDAIPTLCGGVEKPILHIRKLVGAGLLERKKDGYQIHDYLDFNESAIDVKKRREEDRKRKKSERIPAGIQAESERNPAGVLARAPASHPIHSDPPLSGSQESTNKLARSNGVSSTTSPPANGNGHGSSNRPIFKGQRFTVLEWMLENFMQMLGANAGDFAIDEWFYALDAKALTTNAMIDKKKTWDWLHAEFIAEVDRRKIPRAGAKQTDEEVAADILAAIREKDARQGRAQ